MTHQQLAVPTALLQDGASVDSGRTRLDRFLVALRPTIMGPRLAAALGGASSCHVLDAKLEPGVRAIVLYEQGGRLVRGDVIPDAESPSATRSATAAVTVAPGVRLHPFPHDPDLPRLAALLDRAGSATLVARVLENERYSRRAVQTSLLRYRPGKRATFLLSFSGGRLVAKVYHDPLKAAAVATEAPLLGAAARASQGRLRLACTIGHEPESAVVVQEVVAGWPLDVLLPAGPVGNTEAAVRLAARALAALHASRVAAPRRRDGDRELRRFRVRADGIAYVDAAAGEATGLLAERLMRLQRLLPLARPGIVHGDCKPSQFIVDRAGVRLMDFDHLGEADQAGDVGTFLASLRQLALRCPSGSTGRDVALLALREVFLDAYLRCSGQDATERIHWQEAVALERKALRAFARAPRSPLTLMLVAEADRCLDRLERS